MRRPPLPRRLAAVEGYVVEADGGRVIKFEGDASPCVFGAPADQPEMAGEALAAAQMLAGATPG